MRSKILMSLAALLLMILLIACGQTQTSAPNLQAAVPTPQPTVNKYDLTKNDLAYPGAKWVADNEVWPDGLPISYKLFGSFLINATWPTLLDFYNMKLTDLGFKVEPNYTCLIPDTCREVYAFDAYTLECAKNTCAATYQVSFFMVSGRASQNQRELLNWSDRLDTLLKPDLTFVSFGSAGYHQLKIPDGTPTTAAAVEYLTPSPKK